MDRLEDRLDAPSEFSDFAEYGLLMNLKSSAEFFSLLKS